MGVMKKFSLKENRNPHGWTQKSIFEPHRASGDWLASLPVTARIASNGS
jgi:hypothetical protein